MREFVFSRIHYTGLFGSHWKENIFSDLKRIEMEDGFISANGYAWNFCDIRQERIYKEAYITGKILKINPEEEKITIDEHTKEEALEKTANVKEKESFFMIDIERHLISFETSKTFTRNQFVAAFIAAYRKIKKPYDPEFDFTYNEELLFEKLAQIKKAQFAKFQLKTTNPNANKEFKPLDDYFRKSGIDASQLVFKPQKEGTLNTQDPDSMVRQAFSMSAAGYGSGTISGKDASGNDFVVKTGTNLIDKIEIHESRTEEEIKKSIILKFNTKNK